MFWLLYSYYLVDKENDKKKENVHNCMESLPARNFTYAAVNMLYFISVMMGIY